MSEPEKNGMLCSSRKSSYSLEHLLLSMNSEFHRGKFVIIDMMHFHISKCKSNQRQDKQQSLYFNPYVMGEKKKKKPGLLEKEPGFSKVNTEL